MVRQYWVPIITRGLDDLEGGIESRHLQKLNNYQKYGVVATDSELSKRAAMPDELAYEKEVKAANTTVFVHKNTITYTTFLCCEDEVADSRI